MKLVAFITFSRSLLYSWIYEILDVWIYSSVSFLKFHLSLRVNNYQKVIWIKVPVFEKFKYIYKSMLTEFYLNYKVKFKNKLYVALSIQMWTSTSNLADIFNQMKIAENPLIYVLKIVAWLVLQKRLIEF